MKTLPFRLLNSNELYALANRIVEACKQTISDNEFLMTLCVFILAANQDLRRGLGRAFNNEFTSILLLRDEKRDGAFVGLRDFIRSNCNNGDIVKVEAATRLSDIMEETGNNIHRMAYAVETTKLEVLFENFSTRPAREALDTILATDWLERLKAMQEEFEKAYQSKIDTEATIDLPLVKDSKNTITTFLRGLFSYIEINSKIDNDHFGVIEEKINEIITDAITLGRARETRQANAEKEAVKVAK